MAEKAMDRVRIRVLDIAGECEAGHKIGDEIIVDGVHLSGYLCPYALYALWPNVQVLQFKGRFPWGDPDGIEAACPDMANLARFEVRRIKD